MIEDEQLRHLATCEACLRFDKYLSHPAGPNWQGEREFDRAFAEWKRTCPTRASKRGQHKGNGTHNGLFAGTLTMPPDSGLTKEDMIAAMRKILQQRSCPVSKYAWYLERTEQGTPHIHFIYRTVKGGRIEKKHFQRAWALWDESVRMGAGHQGGYHRPVLEEDGYLKYISKGGGVEEHENNF